MDGDDFAQILGYGLIIGFIVIIVALIYMIPTYFLWNWLMPKIFGLPKITMWQSLGILLLTGFLFRSSISKGKE